MSNTNALIVSSAIALLVYFAFYRSLMYALIAFAVSYAVYYFNIV